MDNPALLSFFDQLSSSNENQVVAQLSDMVATLLTSPQSDLSVYSKQAPDSLDYILNRLVKGINTSQSQI